MIIFDFFREENNIFDIQVEGTPLNIFSPHPSIVPNAAGPISFDESHFHVNGWGRDVLLPFFLSYPSSVIRETEN
jgi:hypothetical protein